MSLRVDVLRKQKNAIKRIENLLTTHNCSCGFLVVNGPYAGAVQPVPEGTPDSLSMIGGLYTPALGVGAGEPLAPATTMTALPQQVPPLQSTAPIICLTAGQRGGKTRTGVMIAIKTACSKPGAKIGYLLPAWSKLAIIEPMLDEMAAPLIQQHRLAQNKWTLWNGSTIQAFSITSGSKEQSSYQGFEFDLLVLEEYREFKSPEEHFQGAYSRIISRAGRIVIVSSPEVGHPLEKMAQGKFNGLPVEVHSLSALANPFAKPLEEDPDLYFRLAESLYPTDVYQRNVLGKYVQDRSVDFCDFDRKHHVMQSSPLPDITGSLYSTPHYLRRISKITRKNIRATEPFSAIVGMDLGLNNTALIIAVHCQAGMQADSVNLAYHIRAEIKGENNEGLIKFMERLRSHPLLANFPPSKVLVCFDPYSAQSRSIVDGKTAFQVISSAGYKTLWDRTSRAAAREAVNAKFKSGMLTISPDCKLLIESLLKFKEDGRGQKAISKDKYGHACDALKAAVSVLSPWKDIESHVLSHLYGNNNGV